MINEKAYKIFLVILTIIMGLIFLSTFIIDVGAEEEKPIKILFPTVTPIFTSPINLNKTNLNKNFHTYYKRIK